MRSVRQRMLAFPVRLSIRLSVRLMHANYTHTHAKHTHQAHTPSTHKLNFSVWQSAPVFRAIASPARERVAGRQAGGGSMQSAATTITIATSISWQQHTHTHKHTDEWAKASTLSPQAPQLIPVLFFLGRVVSVHNICCTVCRNQQWIAASRRWNTLPCLQQHSALHSTDLHIWLASQYAQAQSRQTSWHPFDVNSSRLLIEGASELQCDRQVPSWASTDVFAYKW